MENKGKDEEDPPKHGRVLQAQAVRDLYAARLGSVPHTCQLQEVCQQCPYLLTSQPQLCPSAHALVHSVIHPFTHSFTYPFPIHAPTLSPASFIQSFTQLFIHSFTLIHTFTCTPIQCGGLGSCASLEGMHPLGGQVRSERAQPLSLRAWGCL